MLNCITDSMPFVANNEELGAPCTALHAADIAPPWQLRRAGATSSAVQPVARWHRGYQLVLIRPHLCERTVQLLLCHLHPGHGEHSQPGA